VAALGAGQTAYHLPDQAGLFITAGESQALLAADSANQTDQDELPNALQTNAILALHEPRFARQLPSQVEKLMNALGLDRLRGLAICPDNAADFKSGRLLQTLLDYRAQGLIKQIGIVHEDVRVIEWAIENAGPHFVAFPFGPAALDARFRVVEKAGAFDVAMLGYRPAETAAAQTSCWQTFMQRTKLSLGITPVFDQPPTIAAAPMGSDAFETIWQEYQQANASPAELERSRPPE
jgi:hypothetical protein